MQLVVLSAGSMSRQCLLLYQIKRSEGNTSAIHTSVSATSLLSRDFPFPTALCSLQGNVSDFEFDVSLTFTFGLSDFRSVVLRVPSFEIFSHLIAPEVTGPVIRVLNSRSCCSLISAIGSPCRLLDDGFSTGFCASLATSSRIRGSWI